MRALLASPLGFLVGLALGALGGGGSILAVPALVLAAGQDPKAATTTSLVVVGLVALVGVVPHHRAGRVRLGAGVAFGGAGILGALAGSRANDAVDPDVLLLGFALVMVVAAGGLLRRASPAPSAGDPGHHGEGGSGAGEATATRIRVDLATTVRVLLAGTGVGLLTGFFGVGGGFVIVPALVLALGFAMPEAVGTSLVVIAVNSVVALVARAGTGTFEWSVIVPFTVAGAFGVAAGARLAARVEPARLVRAFALALVVVALVTGLRAATGLAA